MVSYRSPFIESISTFLLIFSIITILRQTFAHHIFFFFDFVHNFRFYIRSLLFSCLVLALHLALQFSKTLYITIYTNLNNGRPNPVFPYAFNPCLRGES